MLEATAPGKLMLSGEWSVLEKGIPCIVLAIDKKVKVKIRENSVIKIKLKDFGIETEAEYKENRIFFQKKDQKLLFTKMAIETALEYLKGKGTKIKNFELETESQISAVEVNGEKKKLGFGSSASVVVAIIGVMLEFHKASFEDKEILFKLAIIAHYKAQEKIGSGFDIAASTFGGAVYYKRFDAEWLEKEIKNKNISEVVEEEWPSLEIKKISIKIPILVGFTGKSASTTELVKKVSEFKKQNKEEYWTIINNVRKITEKFKTALEKNNENELIKLIDENRLLLKELSEKSGANLETEEHKKMHEIASKYGGAAKFSGAGGGDSGIAIGGKEILKEWENNGIKPIPVKVCESGFTIIQKTF